jgi:Aminoglycoside/hydroxyurea antibiotic resistance kinase
MRSRFLRFNFGFCTHENQEHMMALAMAKDEHPDMVVSLIVAQINLIAVQPTVRAYAESLGAFGHLWLDSLPDTVRGKCRDWGLQWNEALTGGSRSYVCRVTTSAGHQAVLKLAFPEPLLETQISTLVAAEGRGYVQLIAHDIHQGALLLESLGPSIDEFTDDVPAILLITAKTLLQAWQVSTEHFVSTHDPAEHKAAGLWTLVNDLATGRNVPPAVIDQALRYALERLNALDVSRQVLIPIQKICFGCKTSVQVQKPAMCLWTLKVSCANQNMTWGLQYEIGIHNF